MLVTGDLTDCGLDAEYDIIRELFARLPMPVYAVPGNHDRRAPFRQAFGEAGYLPETGHLNFVTSCGPIRIVGLDSLVPGASHGELASETIDFLERALAAPTLVMLHHPPFDTGIGHMDQARLLAGAEDLERTVSRNPQVKRILCGHVHRSIQTEFGGTVCQISPSVGHQITLDLRKDAPSCFVLEPPEFLVHRFDGARLVTHTAKVDRRPALSRLSSRAIIRDSNMIKLSVTGCL